MTMTWATCPDWITAGIKDYLTNKTKGKTQETLEQ